MKKVIWKMRVLILQKKKYKFANNSIYLANLKINGRNNFINRLYKQNV